MYTVGLYTLGCKVSQYESEAVGEKFESLGFSVLPFSSVCDVYVINTCTVTGESDAKCRKYIRRAKKQNKDALVAVMGCYSQRAPLEVSEIEGVSVVIGTENKMKLPEIVLDILSGKRESTYISTTELSSAKFEPMTVKRAPRTRAYVKIEDGCNSKCTYCAIKDARGPIRSKAPSDVIAEVEALSENGTREVVLTGIETAAYGRDFSEKYTLADLIVELDKRGSCERIRLGSLAPELIDEEFVMKVKDAKILAPEFHLSMQSGSNSVLFKMKRRYSVEMALSNIERIKKYIPRATFTTDLMVGFPEESEEDFKQTLDLVSRVPFLSAHVFVYSRREGTEAYSFKGQIPSNVKKERSERLISECMRVRDKLLSSIVKSEDTLSVILESHECGYYTAHSDTFVEVRIISENENLQGKMVKVRPVSHKDGIVLAELVEEIG